MANIFHLIHPCDAQIKTESGGAKAKASKTGMYKKWKEQSHKKISLSGMAKDTAEEGTGSTGDAGTLIML